MNSTTNTSQSSVSSSTLNDTTTTNVSDYNEILNYPNPNQFLTNKQKRAKRKREMTVIKNNCLKKYNRVNNIWFQFISNVNFSFTI